MRAILRFVETKNSPCNSVNDGRVATYLPRDTLSKQGTTRGVSSSRRDRDSLLPLLLTYEPLPGSGSCTAARYPFEFHVLAEDAVLGFLWNRESDLTHELYPY